MSALDDREALYQPKSVGRVVTMSLEGEIGAREVGDITDLLERVADDGVSRVVLDLSDVAHFDFRGVRPLLAGAETLRELGGDVKLAGLSPYLFAIFRSAGANDAFDYYVNAEEAHADFSRALLRPVQ